MKIRILIDARQIGGIETHAISLCQELSNRSHDCQILFIRDYPGNILYTLCDQKNINYCSFNSYHALTRHLIKEKPDVIHAHGYKANLFARLIGLFTTTRVITTFHSGEKPVGRQILYNFLDRWSSFLSQNICVNKQIANKLPFNATVLPNFVEIPNQPNQLKTTPPYQIYFIGRVSPEKGPERFCELANQSNKEFEWHMVGDGPLLEYCQSKYAHCVKFHGPVTDMDDLWPKVDLLCITSSYEGLPIVLLEAMSRGIPVVSFDVGSVKEVSSTPELIIECFNLSHMRQCISDFIAFPSEQRKFIAEKAKEKAVLNYSKEKIVSKIFSIYEG
jgi:glycosyltransferase involved in cell wall biosynthesis